MASVKKRKIVIYLDNDVHIEHDQPSVDWGCSGTVNYRKLN
jgi:hypothetical protein